MDWTKDGAECAGCDASRCRGARVRGSMTPVLTGGFRAQNAEEDAKNEGGHSMGAADFPVHVPMRGLVRVRGLVLNS